MANKVTEASAQGVEASNQENPAVNQQEQNPQVDTEGAAKVEVVNDSKSGPVEVTPEWAKDLLASNEEVVNSNNAVVKAIAHFNEAAQGLVKEIMDTAKAEASGITNSVSSKPAKVFTIDEDAEYVVAKGMKFHDRDNAEIVYTEGQDVTHLSNDRLQNLLSQGVIKEA